MRTHATLLASLLLGLALAGCTGSHVVHVAPTTSSAGDQPTSPSAPQNQPPVARITLTNETGAITSRQFTGENITANAQDSTDPDGHITDYQWRIIENDGYDTSRGDLRGPLLVLNFTTPGERALLLTV